MAHHLVAPWLGEHVPHGAGSAIHIVAGPPRAVEASLAGSVRLVVPGDEGQG